MRISDWSSDVCSSDLTHLTMLKASSEVASSAPSPSATIANWQMMPDCSPIVVQKPRLNPYFSPEAMAEIAPGPGENEIAQDRSEERRVGKEGVSTGRSRWPPDH